MTKLVNVIWKKKKNSLLRTHNSFTLIRMRSTLGLHQNRFIVISGDHALKSLLISRNGQQPPSHNILPTSSGNFDNAHVWFDVYTFMCVFVCECTCCHSYQTIHIVQEFTWISWLTSSCKLSTARTKKKKETQSDGKTF